MATKKKTTKKATESAQPAEQEMLTEVNPAPVDSNVEPADNDTAYKAAKKQLFG